MSLSSTDRARLLELASDELLGQLDESSARELEGLRARPGASDVEAQLESTLGELILATDAEATAAGRPDASGRLPADLAAKLSATGQVVTGARLIRAGSPSKRSPAAPPPSRASIGFVGTLGWVAAAAGFALAATIWMTRATPIGVTPQPEPGAAMRELAERLEEGDATIRVAFQAAGPIEGRDDVGEVLWDPTIQRGVLRLRNVDANDPAQHQFQLWIFDATREQYAVDGGVFDIGPTTPRDGDGNLLVPFEPRLRVGEAAAFAVTQERPGGVVVTDQTGLILLGPVGG